MSLSVQEAGRKGGLATRNKHGLTFLRRIGQIGGHATAERHKDKLSGWGKKGGRPRKTTLIETEEIPEAE